MKSTNLTTDFHTDIFKYRFISSSKKSDKLMIVLHGRGDSAKPFRKFDEELKIPGMNYLLLNAPRKFLDGYSWYGEPPYQTQGVLKIREKMFQLLHELEMAGWSAENIFLLGFSQGCLVSSDVALHYPKKLGGVVGISGYFHFFPRWKRELTPSAKKTPWLFTHGFQDDVLPIETTKFGVEQLQEAGLKVQWVEMDKDHVFKEEEYPLIRSWVSKQLKTLSSPF